MNEEMLKKLAGGGKSPEEVLAIAKNGELANEALENVAGGKLVNELYCVICKKSYDSSGRIGPDGKVYCSRHYEEEFGNG